jgi:hypothetical protein
MATLELWPEAGQKAGIPAMERSTTRVSEKYGGSGGMLFTLLKSRQDLSNFGHCR